MAIGKHPALDHHKSDQPEKTITRVQSILGSLGIETLEQKTKSCGGGYFSTRISLKSYQGSHSGPGANGKGVTPELARASAYAEFMERLQNSNGLHSCGACPSRYGLMSQQLATPPDAVPRKWSAIESCNPRIAASLSSSIGDLPDDDQDIWTLPFLQVRDGRLCHLPVEMMARCTGTNGMVAGNSPAEAIVQGLCELMERLAMREIFDRNLVCPTIPRKTYQSLNCMKGIEFLERSGLKVIIKDASMGGKYPVVAALVIDPRRNCYTHKCGSDPVLDIAIQRSLTEALQGHDLDSFQQRLMPVLWTDSADKRSGTWRRCDHPEFALHKSLSGTAAQVPDSFFLSNAETGCRLEAFVNHTSHRHMIQRLVAPLYDAGYEIYIRDSSIAGFPAYWIYIPGISEVFAGIPAYNHLNALLRLPQLTADEIREYCRHVESANHYGIGGVVHIKQWFGGMAFRATSRLQSLMLRDMLLTHLYLFAGDFRGAYHALQRHVEEIDRHDGSELENPAYTHCALAFLRLKSDGNTVECIQQTMDDIYGTAVSWQVIKDIQLRPSRFAPFNLPVCGDCDTCPARPDCFFPQWNQLREILDPVICGTVIDQKRLETLFD